MPAPIKFHKTRLTGRIRLVPTVWFGRIRVEGEWQNWVRDSYPPGAEYERNGSPFWRKLRFRDLFDLNRVFQGVDGS